MNRKGETFGCLLGLFGAAAFVLGLFTCIISRFLCIELDFSEEQRISCEYNANFVLIFGLVVIIGSVFMMYYGGKFSGLFAGNTNEIE